MWHRSFFWELLWVYALTHSLRGLWLSGCVNYDKIKHAETKPSLRNLENHLDREDTGEDKVERVEDSVARRVFVDRVFGGQRYTAGADDDHYEQIEVAKIDNEMTKTTQPAHKNTHSYTRLHGQ